MKYDDFLQIELPAEKFVREILFSNEQDFKSYFLAAEQKTLLHFNRRRVFFNPIYISNICMADCPYCGFRKSNAQLKRRNISETELLNELNFLVNRSVSHILLLAGDYLKHKYVDMIASHVSFVKKSNLASWIGVEIASCDILEYEKIYNAGANSVTVFQETYNRNRYRELHQDKRFKGDFDFRLNALERSIKAGFREVGLGVLYGIGDWFDDTLSMIKHAYFLKEKYPDVKFRFSFPRLQYSLGQDKNVSNKYSISDKQLSRIIVVLRLLFPESHLVLTGRENVKFLSQHLPIIDVIGYDGSTKVGGYSSKKVELSQFSLKKELSFGEFRNLVLAEGYEF